MISRGQSRADGNQAVVISLDARRWSFDMKGLSRFLVAPKPALRTMSRR